MKPVAVSEDNVDQLNEHLSIYPPTDAHGLSSALEFRRFREVRLPWGALIPPAWASSSRKPAQAPNTFLRRYLEAGFVGPDGASLSKDNYDASKELFFGQRVPNDTWFYTVEGTNASQDASSRLQPKVEQYLYAVALLDRGNLAAPVSEPGKEEPDLRRYYLLLASDGKPIQYSKGTNGARKIPETWAEYEELWSKVRGLRLAFRSRATAEDGATTVEWLDLLAVVIHREFQNLDVMEEFAKKLDSRIDGAIDSELTTEVLFDPKRLEELSEHYQRVRLRRRDIAELKERLRDRAADAGYVLFLEDKTFSGAGGHFGQEVKKGWLYTAQRRSIQYSVTHTVQEATTVTDGCGNPTVHYETVVVKENKTDVVTEYVRVELDYDPWVEKCASLQADGFTYTYLFQESAEGYKTREGARLVDVVERCRLDEAFRRCCAVLVPKYEESLTGTRSLIGYYVFRRPLPAITPVRFPKILIAETMSYKLAWKRVELGRLAGSVNLGPGEEREISIVKSTTKQTDVSHSTTTTSEISQEHSTDLATEIEREALNDKTVSSSSSVGGSAGGSFGPFSASVSASSSQSSTARSFARQLNRVARKAAHAMNEKVKQEVSSKTTVSTKTTVEEATKVKLRNINDGRVLNLLFFQLNNRFEGGVYLDDLHFAVAPSREIIAGSNIFDVQHFGVDDLDGALRLLDADQLPYPVPKASLVQYWKGLLGHMLATIDAEYVDKGEDYDSINAVRIAGFEPGTTLKEIVESAGTNELLNQRSRLAWTASVVRSGSETSDEADEVWRMFEVFKVAMRRMLLKASPVEPQTLIVPSGAVYADSWVGVRKATEPYAETMRWLNAESTRADVAVKLASISDNEIVSARVNGADVEVSLALPLGPGSWETWLRRPGDVPRRFGRLSSEQQSELQVTIVGAAGEVDLASVERSIEFRTQNGNRIVRSKHFFEA